MGSRVRFFSTLSDIAVGSGVHVVFQLVLSKEFGNHALCIPFEE